LTVSTFNGDFRHIHHPLRISSAKLASFAGRDNALILLEYFNHRDELGAVELVINEL
jgi:hypothetical protein